MKIDNTIKEYRYYVEHKINWNHKRCKHAIERMWLRGISMDEVKDAIIKGKKVKQKDTGLIEAFLDSLV